MRNLAKDLTSGAILITLYLGLLGTFLRWDPNVSGIDEKRSYSQLPTVRGQSASQIIADLDSYVLDNFGFRRFLIRTYALFQHFVMNAYSAENKILERLGIDE